MKITPQKLAVLLDIKKKDARKKIIVALEKKKGKVDCFGVSDEDEEKYEKDPTIDIKDLSKHLGIDLEFYVNDIKENYLKRSQTRGWILCYPELKLKPNKKKIWPKTITVPSHLKCFFSQETVKEITTIWSEKYQEYTKKHGVIFR